MPQATALALANAYQNNSRYIEDCNRMDHLHVRMEQGGQPVCVAVHLDGRPVYVVDADYAGANVWLLTCPMFGSGQLRRTAVALTRRFTLLEY